LASDFLADECVHVELASRVAMELGGGAPRQLDMDALTPRVATGLTARQAANEIVLRISCIHEAFSGGTALANRKAASHPLTRAVYDAILADEARHRRLGGLYFEWAADDLDDAERARLAAVAVDTLEGLARCWRRKASSVRDGVTAEGWRVEDLHALGWLESERLLQWEREVVRRDVLAPLDALGIRVPAEARERLLA
jgi:hypothetical protein